MAPGAEGRPLGQSSQGPSKPESMVTPSPMMTTLVNGQEVSWLIDTGSEVTVMEYDFYGQQFGGRDQLDPSWLDLKAANNPSILVGSVTWVKIQIND